MLTYLVIAAVFVGVAAFAAAATMMFRRDSDAAVESRLELLTSAPVPEAEREKKKSLLAEPLENGPSFVEELFSKVLNLRRFLEQADVAMTPTKFLAISGIAAGVGFGVSLLARLPYWAAPLCALTLAFLPFAWLAFKRKHRLGQFGKQLPEALELISRALRAGHSLGSGFGLVAREMGNPIAKEFTRCFEEQNLGIPLEEALEDLTDRVPNLDLRFFATAVILQRQTGGDLAEILDKIGTLVRERFKIFGAIQALTGEGRISGIVLLALPPVLFITMWRLNPDYVMILFNDPLGHKMLAVAAVLQLVGALVIRKIINIKV